MSYTEKAEYFISTEKNQLDLTLIHEFLSQSYWAKGVSAETVKRSIDNSLCFGLYHSAGQVGFARVVTDYATIAYLADVFIVDDYRGCGLGKWLIEHALMHPQLRGVRKWMLATQDAQDLYARFGFEALAEPECVMERRGPNGAGSSA